MFRIQCLEKGSVKDYWVYYRYSDGFEVDSKGCDVVFYTNNIWKVYTTDRMRSEIFSGNRKMKVSGLYEDYFLLENGKLAVKSNGKIGVIDWNGAQTVPFLFDQIDCLDDSFYRVLIGNKWFLADANGTVLTKKGVDYILPFNSGNKCRFFEFHDNQLHGVFSTDGSVILEANFQQVGYYFDCFIVHQNKGFGLLDSKGKALSSMNYDGYNFQNNYFVLFYSKELKDVFNSKGKLSSKPCSEFVQLDDVLKFYSKDELEIVALNDDGLTVFDRQFFTGDISFEVEGVYRDTLYYRMIIQPDKSHIEEHQLTGYFGLRENFTTKHVEQPNFLEILPFKSFNNYTAIVKHKEIPLEVDDSMHLIAFAALQAFDEARGQYDGGTFVSSTFYKRANGESYSSNRLNYLPNGTKKWWVNISDKKPDANVINSITYEGKNVFAFHAGGSFEPVLANEMTPPLYQNYQWYNDLNTVGIAPASIDRIMNPTKGSKLVGGRWYVQIDAASKPEKVNKALKNMDYLELELGLNEGITFEEAIFQAKKTEDDLVIWNFQEGDSVPSYKYKDVIRRPASFSTLVSADLHVGFVHPSIPDFIYDSIDSDFEFAAGRLIERKGDTTLLWSIDKQLIGTFGSGFYYLNDDLFAVQIANEWSVYNRNGEQVCTTTFDKIQPFTGGLALVEKNDSARVVNLKFETVGDLPSTGFKLKSTGVYVLKSEEQVVYFDSDKKIRDTIYASESFVGENWIYGSDNDKKYVRKIGSKRKLNADIQPIIFGDGLICKENGYFVYINEAEKPLLTRKNKCVTFEKANNVVCFKSANRWTIFNSQGQVLFDAPKGKSINVLKGLLVVETKDTVFALGEDGRKYALDPKGNIKDYSPISTISTGKTSEVVFEENGKYGVKTLDGKIILPAQFVAVLSKQDEVYTVQLPSQVGLGFSYPKEILPPKYESLIPMDTQFIFVRKGQKTGVYTVDGEWIIPLH